MLCFPFLAGTAALFLRSAPPLGSTTFDDTRFDWVMFHHCAEFSSRSVREYSSSRLKAKGAGEKGGQRSVVSGQ
ncbi:MAG: hypothetical protein HYR56_01685 [Acidobacteria bacterium]|nr:hypothetical protein [Acidobacteriota bacterium]MBI3427060.1 hypothetical protein [Acidobacteriota bacterium]